MTTQHVCGTPAFRRFPRAAVEGSIPARFAEQVARHRDCLAVRDRVRELTYGALDRESDRVAAALLDRLGPDPEPVALLLAQGVASVAATLGALKAGKAYVPLDPADPSERLAGLVAQVGARVVLACEETAAAAAALPADVLRTDRLDEDASPPAVTVGPDSVAYVFFTSGSTGEPKGVFDSHRNVLHNVLRYTNTLRLGPADRMSLLQSPTFSGTVSTVFSGLLNGAALFPFRLGDEGLGALADWLDEQEVTVYHSVPAIFRALAGGRRFPRIRLVRLEGDRASRADVDLHREAFGPDSALVNGLGTTETGLVRQLFVERRTPVDDGVLPVGYPVPDVDVVVADGEIAVQSRYLALGYWNRPDLTAAAFGDRAGVRTYRTGDLGRLRRDGCLEYLGRRDGQRKVRGVRVEPAEVEAALLRQPAVREAAVTTREHRDGDGRLVAYVVPDGRRPSAAELRRGLATLLPPVAVPSTFVLVDELPSSAAGKLDRAALPPPVPRETGALRPPADEFERRILALWEDVMDVGAIGVDEDFFALGGDSLAAAQIVAELGDGLRPSALAEAPTVQQLAALVRADGRAPGPVALAPGGSRRPLFLAPDAAGNVVLWTAFARALGEEQPVWGLHPPAEPPGGVEALASHLLADVRRTQSDGPYRLGGFCYGAVVAFELAQQLLAAGEEVELLALVGIGPFDFRLVSRAAWRRYLDGTGQVAASRRAAGVLRRMRALPLRERPRTLARGARSAVPYLRARLGRRYLHPPPGPDWALAAANQRAHAAYRPVTYPGRALVVLAETPTRTYTDDPAHEWRRLARELDLHVLPAATEHQLLEEPCVRELAALLEPYLAD